MRLMAIQRARSAWKAFYYLEQKNIPHFLALQIMAKKFIYEHEALFEMEIFHLCGGDKLQAKCQSIRNLLLLMHVRLPNVRNEKDASKSSAN